ncbi:hypothetical protein FB451DRAFT_1394933 [Mycena latifolia]|nr:hypothetical protein FB451DRAFT_1394933 [Mycena latifolia]
MSRDINQCPTVSTVTHAATNIRTPPVTPRVLSQRMTPVPPPLASRPATSTPSAPSAPPPAYVVSSLLSTHHRVPRSPHPSLITLYHAFPSRARPRPRPMPRPHLRTLHFGTAPPACTVHAAIGACPQTGAYVCASVPAARSGAGALGRRCMRLPGPRSLHFSIHIHVRRLNPARTAHTNTATATPTILRSRLFVPFLFSLFLFPCQCPACHASLRTKIRFTHASCVVPPTSIFAAQPVRPLVQLQTARAGHLG